MTCPTLQTRRLILRPFTEADLPVYTAIMTSGPVRKALYSPDTLDQYGCCGNARLSWPHLGVFRSSELAPP